MRDFIDELEEVLFRILVETGADVDGAQSAADLGGLRRVDLALAAEIAVKELRRDYDECLEEIDD